MELGVDAGGGGEGVGIVDGQPLAQDAVAVWMVDAVFVVGAGEVTGVAQRLRCARLAKGTGHDVDRCGGAGAPGGVHGQWTGSRARAEPAADPVLPSRERARRAGLVRRPVAVGDQRAMRDADRREVEQSAQMQGHACAPGVVAAGGVDEKNVRACGQGVHRSEQQGARAKKEQPGLVRSARSARDDGFGDDPAVLDDRGRSPPALATLAESADVLRESCRAAADR